MVALVPVDSRLAVSLTDPTTDAPLRVDGVEDLVREVVDSAVAGTGPDADPDGPWGTYLASDPDTGQVVGTCGFRGPPRGGRVEIAFVTFPPFEGRGWATAMARALVALAHAHQEVHTVLAHTLPGRDPAASVLRANGLRWSETVRRDRSGPGGTPEGAGRGPFAGRVWRWELRRRTDH